jgi:peptidoglycan hydrolase-like protein with peptidoglycan-binding domain
MPALLIIRVQAALMRLGFFDGDISGVLDEETRTAIKSFQRHKKFKETGRIDLNLLSALEIPIP